MAASRSAILFFVLAGIGTGLFIGGLFSPGWSIEKSKYSETFEGIFFKIKCKKLGDEEECERKTYLEIHEDEIKKDGNTWFHEFDYSQRVGYQVIATLSLAAILLGTFFCFLRLVIHRYSITLGALVSPFFIISACLIWTHIGMRAALMRDTSDYSRSKYDMPYSLILTAVGSFLVLVVGVIQLGLTLRNIAQIQKEIGSTDSN